MFCYSTNDKKTIFVFEQASLYCNFKIPHVTCMARTCLISPIFPPAYEYPACTCVSHLFVSSPPSLLPFYLGCVEVCPYVPPHMCEPPSFPSRRKRLAPPPPLRAEEALLRGDRTKTKAGGRHIPICEGQGAPVCEYVCVCVYLYACQTAVGRTHKRGKERGGKGRKGVWWKDWRPRKRCVCAKEEANQSLAVPLPPRDCNFLLNAIHGCGGLLPREPKKKLKEEKWYYKVHRL